MRFENERSVKEAAQPSFSRRDFLTGVGALSSRLVFPHVDISSPTSNSDAETVPDSLSNSFTTDIEEIHLVGATASAFTTVCNDEGYTTATYTITSHNELQKMDYYTSRKKYELSNGSVTLPLRQSHALIGFADHEKQDNELVVVVGNNFSEETSLPTAAIAISTDSGKSFDSIQLEDSRGQEIQGKVLDVKKIPHHYKALLRIGHEQSAVNKFGVFNLENNELTMINERDYQLPLIDDLFVHPENPSVLIGTGRVVPENDTPQEDDFGITEFELDLESAEIISSKTHHKRLNNLDGIHVTRDENGITKSITAIQSYGSLPQMFRAVYTLNPENESESKGFRYDGFDTLLAETIDTSTQINRDIIHEGVLVRLHDIHTFEHGIWSTGNYLTVHGTRPFVAYWQPDSDFLPKEDTLQIYPFDHVHIFPADINQHPEFVKLKNGDETKSDETQQGVLINMNAVGTGLIQTDEEFRPIDALVLYQLRNPNISIKI